MKKLIVFLSLFFVGINFVGAENIENNSGTIKTEQTSTGIPENEKPPVSHLEEKSKTKYIYYYGEGCKYCIKLDKFFEEYKIFENFDIIKKEIWRDRDNALELMGKAQKLGINNPGTPFLLVQNGDEEIGLEGLDKIENHFKKLIPDFEELEKELEKKEVAEAKSKDSNKTIVIIVLILLAIVCPIAFIKMSK